MPEFGLLGELRIVTDEGSVRLPDKERSLLATLLLHPRQVVGMDTLIDVLWDSMPPPSARNTIHGYIKRLRRRLGDENGRVVTRGRGYLADVQPGELDLDQFTELHAAALAEARTGNWATVSSLLARALRLWRGEPLADVTSPALRRTDVPRLAELRDQAMDLRIEAELNCGRHGEVTADLMRLVAAQPLRERPWAQLMLALYRSHRQGEALSAYQRARTVLRAELGIDPGSELADLHRRILAADPSLELRPAPGYGVSGGEAAQAAPAEMAVPVPPRPMQIPADTADFTGRAESITQIREELRPPEGAPGGIVVISGPGGIGKSTLAVHVAHLLADKFPSGQLYCDLGGTSGPVRPTDVLAYFLRELGVPDAALPPNETGRSARFRSILADRRMLILLDDARDAAQVRPLLPGAGGSAVMVTSRSSLTDLSGSWPLDLGALAPSEAAGLFAAIVGQRAREAKPDETSMVLKACAGLPLAIRIAASRLAARPGWTVGELGLRLADERQRLAELKAGDVAVRASFAVSYTALPAELARIFRMLGVSGLPLIRTRMVAALTDLPSDAVTPALEMLVDAHLLQSPAAHRYQLHDLLRIYAAELADKAEDREERAAVVDRMMDFYTASAISAARLLHPSRRFPGSFGRGEADKSISTPGLALEWFEEERVNLVSVTARAAEVGRHDVATLVPAAMWAFFQRTAFHEDWLLTHQIGVASARRVGDNAITSWLLNGLGQVRGRMGHFTEALPSLLEALWIRRRIGNRPGEAAVLNSLGLLHADHGDPEEGLNYLRQAYAIHAGAGDLADLGVSLNNIGDVLLRLKRHDEALESLRQALVFRRAAGDRYGEGLTESTIGEAHWTAGEYEDAVAHLRLALTAFKDDGGEERHLGPLLYQLGSSLDFLGRSRDALQTWNSALPALDRIGDPRAGELRRKLSVHH
jgi:DNA-binding SARP family transcriptional activator/tetratricopeptide (TPR) repeat protein